MFDPSGSPTSRFNAAILSRTSWAALDRVAHMKERARPERSHVVGRDVGIALYNTDEFRWDVERLADHLCQAGIGALAHVDRPAIEGDGSIGGRR